MMDWQHVLATDSKFNAYRAPKIPGFKSLYLRRRTQLLQSLYNTEEPQPAFQSYLPLRINLLQNRYKVSLDQLSQKSFSHSARPSSRTTIETRSDRSGSKGQATPSYKPEVSRPMVSSTSIAESYAFSGMHHIFDQHKDSVTMVKFGHNDVTLLGCSSMDGTVTICKMDDVETQVQYTLRKHTAGVTGFDWSCSNDLLVSSGLDGQLCLWNACNGTYLRSVADQAKSQILCCTFHSLNSNWVVAGNSTGMVQVVNVSTGRFPPGGTGQLSDAIGALNFDASGTILFVGNSKGVITSFKFDITTGQLRKARRIALMEGSAITCLSTRSWVRGDARTAYLLANATANAIFVFRVTDGEGSLKLKKKFPLPHSSQQIQSIFAPIISSRQGSCVVTGSEDGKVWVLDIERDSNPVINKLQGHSAPVLSVSFSYDESLLASSDASGLVIIWKRQLDR